MIFSASVLAARTPLAIEVLLYILGIGEQGRPGAVKNAPPLVYKSGCNEALGNLISLHRSLPDVRHPACAKRLYLASLPSVSVVIPFYDEALSTLLRTVHSVLARSPPQLIKEVILVNDNGVNNYDNGKCRCHAIWHAFSSVQIS